jgi:DNA-binding MarR family transcriptional regulator
MNREKQLEQLLNSFGLIKRLMHFQFQRHFEQHQLAPAQLQILFVMADCEKITPKSLAARLYLTPGAVTQLVEPLVQREFVSREADTADRRVTNLLLTPKAHSLMHELKSERQKFMAELVSGLSDEEFTQLIESQRKLVAALEAHQHKERNSHV